MMCRRTFGEKGTNLHLMNYNTGHRGFHDIISALGVSENRSQAQPWIFFLLSYASGHEWQQRRVINPLSRTLTSKCFQPHTALLLGPVWHFSALSLWGCNINKAPLKVHQLLKLSRSLPITVTTQCLQHKNMFSLYNSQQTWQKKKKKKMQGGGTPYIETRTRKYPAQFLQISKLPTFCHM